MSSPLVYNKGQWEAICDVCGYKFKSSELRQRWDGLRVCHKDFELRQPQDFVRAKIDIQSVPWSRPEATDTFIAVCTPDGMSAIVDFAVVECCIVEFVSSMFDPTINPPIYSSISIDVPTTISNTLWAQDTWYINSNLTLIGLIGVI